MKETIMKRILYVLVMSALFFSCSDEIQIQEQHGKATVSFSVTDGRTVFPQFSLADAASYQLRGGLNGGAETTLVQSFTGTGTAVSLVPGTWNFTLNAYNSAGGYVLQGTVENKQINLTGTNQVTFTLSPVNSGTGAIRITLNFPESAYVSQINTSGDFDSENPIPANSGSFIYTKSGIPAGDYFINFELYCRNDLRSVVSELVLVRSNLTSVKTITLAGDNLKPIPEIIIELAAMNEWQLTEQTAVATPNVNKEFIVSGTYTAYRWYLDGAQVGTSPAYTFNKPAGVYQLIVVATNGAGESRSGRCRITVGRERSLSVNVWANGSINDANNEDWYSFPVVSGTRYYIWWNDKKEGNGTKNGDIVVGARYENETTFIFGGTDTTVDSSWTTPQSFTANQTGMVYLRVIPYNRVSSNFGSYGIVYNTSGIKPVYTVTFNANGGSGVPPAQMAIAGYSITLPVSGPSRSGYVFGGWNTNASGTGTNYDAGSPYRPAADITLYARWHPAYTVTFNANGGSGTPPANRTGSAVSGITIPDGSGLSRSGYVFGGWNTNTSGTGTNYVAGASYTPATDITLYAWWRPAYTVTFSASGGNTAPAPYTVIAGSSIFLPGGRNYSLSGFIFGGWNTNASGTGTSYLAGASYTPTADITLYMWWHVAYTVTFNANGENGTTPSQTVIAGSSVLLPNSSFTSRYTFDGWYFNTSGTGTKYTAGAEYVPAGNVTFYASWYSRVSFDVNGGTFTQAHETRNVPKGSSVYMPVAPSKPGDMFVAWADDNGVLHGTGSSYTPTGNVILVARWSSGLGN